MDLALKLILKELESFDPLVVYQFGSSVQGTEHPGSDLDLTFLPRHACDSFEVFEAAQRIASIVRRDVDLIDLRCVGDVMKVQVIGAGKRIYTSDELAADTFEMLALSDYARLNGERREVLAKAGLV